MVLTRAVLLYLIVLNVYCLENNLPPRVISPSGPLIGTYMKVRGGRTISAFLSIPFAKPPLGELRFEPPVPAEPWVEYLIADTLPKRCYQGLGLDRLSEDCLYLNVYTPSLNATNPMPVMIYIYSGGFDFGAAEDYTPEYILEEADILFVTIQYRLNVFGFLSTGDSVVPGNMGLKDLRLGLFWVQQNIHSFGGDPTKVTLWGESSSAATVHWFMISLANQGLFRAAICHSQSALSPSSFRPPQEVNKFVQVFSDLTNCPSDSYGFVACLKAKSALELVYLYQEKYKPAMYAPMEQLLGGMVPQVGPVLEPECVEDRIVTSNPWQANTSLPWLVGVNSKESLFQLKLALDDITGVIFAGLDAAFELIYPLMINYQNSEADGSQVPKAVRKFYLDNLPITRTTLSQAVDAFSDPNFVYGVYEAVRRGDTDQTYVYYLDRSGFNQVFEVPRESRIGANHAEELFYFFPYPALQVPRQDSESDINLSKILVKMWTNFAIYLNPTPIELERIKWNTFSKNESYLNIKQNKFEMSNQFLSERMQFWQTQPFPKRDDNFGSPPC